MLDHSGRRRVRYEDTFRALGHHLDEEKFSQIAVFETPEGFLLKGQVLMSGGSGNSIEFKSETYLFSNEDIDVLIESAFQRRRR